MLPQRVLLPANNSSSSGSSSQLTAPTQNQRPPRFARAAVTESSGAEGGGGGDGGYEDPMTPRACSLCGSWRGQPFILLEEVSNLHIWVGRGSDHACLLVD